jgi:hypothetical protein
MIGVAAGAAFGVDECWWDELGTPVPAHPHGPVAVVAHPMVEFAEQNAIINIGGAAV